jgi:hypothetical protein
VPPARSHHHDQCAAVTTWLAELPLTWVIDGQHVPGRIAIGIPELVDGGDEGEDEGETTCTIALDGLQPRTTVRDEGRFHTLLLGFRSIDARIRGYVSGSARGVPRRRRGSRQRHREPAREVQAVRVSPEAPPSRAPDESNTLEALQ